jgi:hypothetical protein
MHVYKAPYLEASTPSNSIPLAESCGGQSVDDVGLLLEFHVYGRGGGFHCFGGAPHAQLLEGECLRYPPADGALPL